MSADAPADDIDPDLEDALPGAIVIAISPDDAGPRLDKVLAAQLADISRARLQALIAQGALTRDGVPLTDGSVKAVAGTYLLRVPEPTAAEPAPEDLPLTVLYEDAHLIVVDKPAGMAAHPAPGCESGTLVNALLFRCAGSLSGVGGVARPGIVHRLDKDTSGVMVAAKSDAAHAGLSALFATHDIDRAYIALTRGAPCLGDPVYGAGAPATPVREAMREAGLTRQALHAAVLGFRHPITGEMLRFETTPPPDMAALESMLGTL